MTNEEVARWRVAVSSSTAGNSSRLKCVWEEMMAVCRWAAAPPPCQIGPVQSSSTSVSFNLRHPLHTRFLSYLYCKVGHKHKFSFYKQKKKQWDYKLTVQFSLCDPSSVSCCVSKNHSIQPHGIPVSILSNHQKSWLCDIVAILAFISQIKFMTLKKVGLQVLESKDRWYFETEHFQLVYDSQDRCEHE